MLPLGPTFIRDPRLRVIAANYCEILRGPIGPVHKSVDDVLATCAYGYVQAAIVRLFNYACDFVRADNTLPFGITELSQEIDVPVEILRELPKEIIYERTSRIVEFPNFRANRAHATDEQRKRRHRAAQARHRERKRVSEAGPNVMPFRREDP